MQIISGMIALIEGSRTRTTPVALFMSQPTMGRAVRELHGWDPDTDMSSCLINDFIGVPISKIDSMPEGLVVLVCDAAMRGNNNQQSKENEHGST